MLSSRIIPGALGRTARRLGVALITPSAVSAVILSATAAQAQDRPRFSVSPRLYYVSITGPDQEKPLEMALAGLSASFSIAPQWDITATGLYGKGETGSFDGTRTNDSTRLDLELVARYRIPESPTYLTGGYRQLGVDDEMTISGVRTSDSEVMMRAVQFGAGFATRIPKSGRHAAFANVNLGGGTFEREEFRYDTSETITADGTLALIDTNVGDQYAFNGWVAASARYRVIALRLFVDGIDPARSRDRPDLPVLTPKATRSTINDFQKFSRQRGF